MLREVPGRKNRAEEPVGAGSAGRRGASASQGCEGEAGRWCDRASHGQPEPRPALGSASEGCRSAGCGSRQCRRRRATAATVTGQLVQGERHTTERVVAHAGKLGGSEDATAASSAAAPMAIALWHPRASSGEREGEVRESQRELGRWAFTKGGRRDATGRQGRGCTRRRWRGRAHAWLPRTGHAASFGAFPRTPGGRRSGRSGTRI